MHNKLINPQKLFKRGGEEKVTSQYQISIVEDVEILTDSNLRLVLPDSLRVSAIAWYHHWLQHQGHTRLEETLHHVFTYIGSQGQICSCVFLESVYLRAYPCPYVPIFHVVKFDGYVHIKTMILIL